MDDCCEQTVELTAKERVELELEELKQKIAKLSLFLFSKEIIDNKLISREMYNLMRNQLSLMQDYARTLQGRLKIWDKTDEELFKQESALRDRVCY